MRLILNKITYKTFDDLSNEFIALEPIINSTHSTMKRMANVLFNKVIDEPQYAHIYARLCRRFKIHQQIAKSETSHHVTSFHSFIFQFLHIVYVIRCLSSHV